MNRTGKTASSILFRKINYTKACEDDFAKKKRKKKSAMNIFS